MLVFAINKWKKRIKTAIKKKTQNISYYLEIEKSRDKTKNKLFLSQKKYVNDLPSVQDVCLEKNTEQAELKDTNLYQQQIGFLMYLMTVTRPNIAFSVSNYARFMSNSNKKHFNALNRIWQYVKTTKNKALLYESSDEYLTLKGYVDSDWGGDFTTRKSTTNYQLSILTRQCAYFIVFKIAKIGCYKFL